MSEIYFSIFRRVYQRLFPYIDQVIQRGPQQPVVELNQLFPEKVTYKAARVRDEDDKVEREVEIKMGGKRVLRQALFLATTPHLDNVTDDYGYSKLLVDFMSVEVSFQWFFFSKKRSF